MSNQYNEDYFQRGVEKGVSLYSCYRWMPELTIPMAYEIIKITGVREYDKILDFGCSMGFLVKAFRLLGMDTHGIDISEYAIAEAPSDVADYVQQRCDGYLYGPYHLVIAKDVFEHLDDKTLDIELDWIAGITKKIFVMVPLGDGEKYIIPSYELDKTHVQRQSLAWWRAKLESHGFDVDARYQWGRLKENWTKVNPQGNGFLFGIK